MVAIFVLKIGFESAKDSVYALMDISPNIEIKENIKKAIDRISGVEDFKDLKCRKSGPFIFGEVTIKVKEFLGIDRAHEIANDVERKIKEQVPSLESFIVHIVPLEKTKSKVVIPTINNKGLKSKISDRFGRSNYFAFVSIDKKKMKLKI